MGRRRCKSGEASALREYSAQTYANNKMCGGGRSLIRTSPAMRAFPGNREKNREIPRNP